MTAPNDLVIAEFRANGGAVVEAMGGHFKEVHLLLLHHTGTRTGRRYVTPLIYVADGDSYVLVGSNGGGRQGTRVGRQPRRRARDRRRSR